MVLIFIALLGVVIGVLLNAASDVASVCIFLLALIVIPKVLFVNEGS